MMCRSTGSTHIVGNVKFNNFRQVLNMHTHAGDGGSGDGDDHAKDKKLVITIHQNIAERKKLFKETRHHDYEKLPQNISKIQQYFRGEFMDKESEVRKRCTRQKAETILNTDLPRLKYRLGYYRDWERQDERHVDYHVWSGEWLPVLDYMTFETTDVVHLDADPDQQTIYAKRVFFIFDLFPSGYDPTMSIDESQSPKVSFIEIYDLDTRSVHYINLKVSKYTNPFDVTEKHEIILRPTADAIREESKIDGGVFELERVMLTQIHDAVQEDQTGVGRTTTSLPVLRHKKDGQLQYTATFDPQMDCTDTEVVEGAESYMFGLLSEVSRGQTDDVHMMTTRRRSSLKRPGSPRGQEQRHKRGKSTVGCDKPPSTKRVTFATDTNNRLQSGTSTRNHRPIPFPIYGEKPPEDDAVGDRELQFGMLWVDESHFKSVYASFGSCTRRVSWPVENLPHVIQMMRASALAEYTRVVIEATPHPLVDVKDSLMDLIKLEEVVASCTMNTPVAEYASIDNKYAGVLTLDGEDAKIKMVRSILLSKPELNRIVHDEGDSSTRFADLGCGQFLHTTHVGLLREHNKSYNPFVCVNTAPSIQMNPTAAQFCKQMQHLLTWDESPEDWVRYRQDDAKYPSVAYSTNFIGDEIKSIAGVSTTGANGRLTTPYCTIQNQEFPECYHEYRATSKQACATRSINHRQDVALTVHESRTLCIDKLNRVKSLMRNKTYAELVNLPDFAHQTTVDIITRTLSTLTKTEHASVFYDSKRDNYVITSSLLPTTGYGNETCALVCRGPLSRSWRNGGGILYTEELSNLCSDYFNYSTLGRMKQRKIIHDMDTVDG